MTPPTTRKSRRESVSHQLQRLISGRARSDARAEAVMFRGVQRRLVLWYGGVLAAILLLSGVVLYSAMQQELLGPVDNVLAKGAQAMQRETIEHGVEPCEAPLFAVQGIPYIACYDATGSLIAAPGPSSAVPAFLSTSLAAQTLNPGATGAAQDTIDGGNGLGSIRRYALVVRDATNTRIVAVAQVGVGISDRSAALNTLLTLLLEIGALTLIGAGVGGRFLSGRALEPARLAFARQQRFIGDAAHELRTPLTLLRADAEVLLRGRERLQPDDVALVQDIVTETQHLSMLATNLLTLARLDAGSYHLERDVVNLTDVATSVVRRARRHAEERRITLTAEGGGDGPVLVVGDRGLLDQAALILLDNAIKYNRPGGAVTLRVSRVGQQARLDVQDTGEGIPDEHLSRLGERFYRVDKARSREAGGAGLGLSIARGIAAVHQGALQLASAPGHGTSVTLTLPAAAATPRERLAAPSHSGRR
jgi:signal transduction histidine kinase